MFKMFLLTRIMTERQCPNVKQEGLQR